MNESALLAERMRPQQLSQVIGQEHITAVGGILHSAVQQKKIPSIVFWGPPGVGKTTLAIAIATESGLPFYQLSAVSAGVKEVREVIELAKKQGNVILFIDEIHRFNKGQQDALLGAVEKGIITLLGATTENPSFELNSALLSRCQVFILHPLQKIHLEKIIHQALLSDTWLQQWQISLADTEALVRLSCGDGRKLLNLLEISIQYLTKTNPTSNTQLVLTNEVVMTAAQQTVALYDKKGEMHYDIISAFIKSMRGSDPNGAVYWLARMIEGGESVTFIARRMVIFSSEDIGNANPTALVMATTCFDAVQKIGYPESRIILSQCAIYLAASAKSNASYIAIGQAQEWVHQMGDLPVPLHLRNAPTSLMKQLDYGKDYTYSHLGAGNFIPQEYLPEALAGKKLYEPGKNTREEELRKFLKARWGDKYDY